MASLEVPVQIDLEALASRVTEQIRGSRESVMALTYGEAVTKASAAKMLNVTGRTICQMIRDGRLLDACRGERVDTRSIARYIENRTEMDHEARIEKKRRRAAC